MSRSGQTSRVNKFTKATKVPAVIAPCWMRHVPRTSSTTMAIDGNASRAASKVARNMPTWMRESRKASARVRNRAVSASSAPSVLTTSAPSKLSWATVDTSPTEAWARVAGTSTLRW